jgi:hypothetical protein
MINALDMHELKQMILTLPAAERLRLATFILASLSPDEVADSPIPEAWLAEARAEADRMENGESQLKTWEEVKAAIKAKKHEL